jgi:hypothetical protein
MELESKSMQSAMVVTLVLHVLSGVFWAGSTFTLARTGGAGAEKLYRPQMGAAAVAILTGGVLWHLLHRGSPGKTEYILALGALAAVVAAGVQGAWRLWAMRKIAEADHPGFANVQRVAGVLLAVAVICMAAARYA